jgi:hypothetical protein
MAQLLSDRMGITARRICQPSRLHRDFWKVSKTEPKLQDVLPANGSWAKSPTHPLIPTLGVLFGYTRWHNITLPGNPTIDSCHGWRLEKCCSQQQLAQHHPVAKHHSKQTAYGKTRSNWLGGQPDNCQGWWLHKTAANVACNQTISPSCTTCSSPRIKWL